jgi:hypothetical protein
MVRLVFRPYTQIWRSICTSESLRASTRVSPGFALPRHSSPSFGSQHLCSNSNLNPKECDRPIVHLQAESDLSLSLRSRVSNSPTRIHVRLLGPCFKTGQIKPFRQLPELKASSSVISTVHLMSYNRTNLGNEPDSSKSLSCEDNSSWHVKRHSAHGRNRMKYTSIHHWFYPLPFQQFQVLFNSLFKVLFIFPSRYLFAIGLLPLFSFRRNLPPI